MECTLTLRGPETGFSRVATAAALALALSLFAGRTLGSVDDPQVAPIAPGPYGPDWESLEHYQCPDWFRDAKFGIWAHWGAQCEPEMGDWYAHEMYLEGSRDYAFHVARYGHPSRFGFKDVIHEWKAARFDPESLLAFYKENGARYFVALATHCDNFDNFNSRYQPWNSVNMGPHRDLIRDWASAARRLGLRFGVSLHDGGWTWQWYEVSRKSDSKGPLKGVPYDGVLTKADGKGTWWEGFDPQDLYAQNHPIGAPPDGPYCTKYFLRTRQLMDDYKPDLVYFDEGPVPMSYPQCRASPLYGLSLYAHFYNETLARTGRNDAVITAKLLSPDQRRALVYDIERGKAAGVLPEAWQTDTCLGDWHYNRERLDEHSYKTAGVVIPMLADIVSKNGNLLLSVPVRADGTIDEDERRIVADIGAWLRVNGEAIYGTRPWTVYGEGPSITSAQQKGEFDGVSDVGGRPYTPEDIRFTRSKDGSFVYAIILGIPSEGRVLVRSLNPASCHVVSVSLLGCDSRIGWRQTDAGLDAALPSRLPCSHALALRVALGGESLKPVSR